MSNIIQVELTFQNTVSPSGGAARADLSSLVNSSYLNVSVALVEVSRIKVMATTTANVEVPGLYYIRALAVSADKPVDISLANDLAEDPLFSGSFCLTHARYFADQSVFNHLKIKAGAQDAIVRVFLAGDVAP